MVSLAYSLGYLAKERKNFQRLFGRGPGMTELPACPYCGTLLTDSIPQAVEGSIHVRCPRCDSIYAFTPGIGSLPMEDDMNIHISRGRFSFRVSIGEPPDSFSGGGGFPSRSSAWTCICILSIIIIAVGIMLMFTG
ncbi:MAG: hypothetical protein C4K48_00110 [Candidatus Thorarchaeota archaeon]|nr:MAG: hypothetical protein C4K48_00110 [Candidatus Thorarchaeota archaeon]